MIIDTYNCIRGDNINMKINVKIGMFMKKSKGGSAS